MARASILLVSLSIASLFVFNACGGDTTESDGSGGSGGKILDSGPSDAQTEAATDAAEDTAPDVSQDVSIDQSVEAEAEAALPDGDFIEGSLFDLEMPDVVLNDSGATLQGCYDCAVASCSSEMAECEQDDKCRTILLCLFEDQCFGGANGIDYACGMSCATQAGISGFNDPAIAIALGAGQCIAGACREDCGLPEDGGLPDAF